MFSCRSETDVSLLANFRRFGWSIVATVNFYRAGFMVQIAAVFMSAFDEKRAANDKRVAIDVREYGCHVISVFDPKEVQPFFSYSVGIQETSSVPEAIVVGLKSNIGGFMINEYNRQVKAGARFQRGVRYSGFLEGFEVYIEPARRRLLADYTYGCDRYYGEREYSVVQIIWPSTAGVWPWQKSASVWFRGNQPMLGRVRPNRA